MGLTCHGCRHGKPCVKDHPKKGTSGPVVEARADTLTAHAAIHPPKPAPGRKQAPGVYVLSVAEIRALHAVPPNLPPGSLGLLGPCRCPVCDPAFHGLPV